MELAVLGAQAATVAQLAEYAGGLISKIMRAAETARQNKRECDHLARRVCTIAELLPALQRQDQEVARPLAGLGDTLQEAHDLVVSCQKRSAASQFFQARGNAERFREVNGRIDSHLILIPLLSHIALTRRLDQILLPNHAGVPTTMVAASPSSGSRPLQLEPAMVSYVSSSSHVAPEKFTSAEIAVVTENFTRELGKDSSGTAYKGRLHDGREVAVKSLIKHGRQGVEDAFVAEFEILFRVRHEHIVRLVGWCAEDEERTFVYEHTSNGTLRDHLRGGSGSPPSPVTASWKTRVEALLGASRAIDHLHRSAVPRVIHRNVSSSSILLDASWTPRVSDFGAAVWQATGEEHGQPVAEVVGTFGYLDPEYLRTKRVSPASDVYSFGVVMLEVLTGLPPETAASSWRKGEDDPMTLVDFALPNIKNGRLGDVLDGRPEPEPTPRQLEALQQVADTALHCLRPQGENRPPISAVVYNLERALELIRSDEPRRLY